MSYLKGYQKVKIFKNIFIIQTSFGDKANRIL